MVSRALDVFSTDNLKLSVLAFCLVASYELSTVHMFLIKREYRKWMIKEKKSKLGRWVRNKCGKNSINIGFINNGCTCICTCQGCQGAGLNL